jgi:hypothetical protein
VLPVSSAVAAGQSATRVSSDYSSIFSDQPALAGSGWARCSSPIGWSADVHSLTGAEAKSQLANISWALSTWSQASGLTFVFEGATALRFNERDFTLAPADGSSAGARRILVDFVPDGESVLLTRTTVGQGAPSSVMTESREIVSGTAVFSVEHSRKATVRQMRSLYLHELGHVLGLAHAHSAKNVMYPIVRDRVRLGAGDINGVRSLVKPCRPNSPEPTGSGPGSSNTPVTVPPVVVPPVTVPPVIPGLRTA